MALTVEEVQAVLSLKDELSSKLDTVNMNVDKTGSAFSGMGKMILGALSVAAVTSAIGSYVKFTGTLNDMSAKTGISTEALQRLKFAAEQNGGSLDTVTGAVTKLSMNLAGGEKSAVGALGALGLSFKDIRSMSPDQAFIEIGDAIAKVPNPMDRAKVAMDLFGKSGAELLPMMRGNLSETAKEADRLGIVMSDDMVKAGDAFGDSLDSLMLVGMSVIAKVLGPMVPALVEVATWLGKNLPGAINTVINALKDFGKLVSDNADFLGALVASLVLFKIATIAATGVQAALAFGVGGVSAAIATATTASLAFMVAWGPIALAVAALTATLWAGKIAWDAWKTSSGTAAEASKTLATNQQNLIDLNKRFGTSFTNLNDAAAHANKQIQENAKQVSETSTATDAAGAAVTRLNFNYALNEEATKKAAATLELLKKGVDETHVSVADFTKLVRFEGLEDGRQEILKMNLRFGELTDTLDNFKERFSKSADLFPEPTPGNLEAWKKGQTVVAETIPVMWKLRDVGVQSLSVLNGIFQSAFEGGGNIGGALKSFATNLLSTIPVVGQFAGAIVSGFTKVFGNVFGNKEIMKINDMRDAWFNLQGGLESLNPRIQQLTGSVTLVQAVFDAKTVTEYEAAIRAVKETLDQQGQSMQALEEVASKYNLTIEEMGPAWQKQEMEKKAMELYKDYQILTSAGLNHTMVIGKMSGSINEYVKNALKMGLEVPEAMRPMLQEMVEQGLLTDAAGKKITDLEKSGLSFSMTMSEGFKSMIAEVQKLTDAITRGLGLSLKNVPDVPAPWADWEPPPELPDYGNRNNNAGSFALGGPVKKTGLALVHQGEFVVPRGGASLGSGGGSDMSGMEARLQSIERLLSVLPAAFKSAVLVGAR